MDEGKWLLLYMRVLQIIVASNLLHWIIIINFASTYRSVVSKARATEPFINPQYYGMGRITTPSVRFYSRSRRKKDFGKPIPIQVVCNYDRKRLAITSVYTPELTAKEFALFDSDGELKNPIPETTLTQAEIDKAVEIMRNSKAFWLAAIYEFIEPFGKDWQTLTLSDFEGFVWDNAEDIAKRARTLRKSGGCK